MTSTSCDTFLCVSQNISENQNEHKPESKSLDCIEKYVLSVLSSYILDKNIILMTMLITKYLSIFQSSTRKSAILSAAKKAKLKSNPSRVRFAESVDINGSLGLTVSSIFTYCMHY